MTNKEYLIKIKDLALLDEMPLKLAELIAAQAAHETGWFSSRTFEQNKNLFGYKYVKGARWQVGPGRTSTEGDSYAHYATLDDSVHELTAWIKRRQHDGLFPADLAAIETPEEYANLLKACDYYGAPVKEYVAGLTRGLNASLA